MARPAFPTAAASDPAHDTENAEAQDSPAALLETQNSSLQRPAHSPHPRTPVPAVQFFPDSRPLATALTMENTVPHPACLRTNTIRTAQPAHVPTPALPQAPHSLHIDQPLAAAECVPLHPPMQYVVPCWQNALHDLPLNGCPLHRTTRSSHGFPIADPARPHKYQAAAPQPPAHFSHAETAPLPLCAFAV